jgi:hypothetical protein
MIQSVRNYAHIVNRGLEKEFVVCSTVSLREAQRRGNPADAQGNPRMPSQTGLPHPYGLAMTKVCGLPRHLVVRNDSVRGCIRKPGRTTSPIPPIFTLVIARSVATWQSSDSAGQPRARPSIPNNVSDWIATPLRARNDKKEIMTYIPTTSLFFLASVRSPRRF